MTLRTSSVTRFSVVSKSSVVFTTSATSSRRGSTSEARSVCEAVVFTSFIIAADGSGSSTASFVICNLKIKRPGTITNCPLQIFQHADIRKIPIPFRIVQAVADHVGVGNREADILRLDRLL